MTIPQIQGFLEAITKRQAAQHAMFVTNVAVGAQSNSKGIKKTIDAYKKQRLALSRKKQPVEDKFV